MTNNRIYYYMKIDGVWYRTKRVEKVINTNITQPNVSDCFRVLVTSQIQQLKKDGEFTTKTIDISEEMTYIIISAKEM